MHNGKVCHQARCPAGPHRKTQNIRNSTWASPYAFNIGCYLMDLIEKLQHQVFKRFQQRQMIEVQVSKDGLVVKPSVPRSKGGIITARFVIGRLSMVASFQMMSCKRAKKEDIDPKKLTEVAEATGLQSKQLTVSLRLKRPKGSLDGVLLPHKPSSKETKSCTVVPECGPNADQIRSQLSLLPRAVHVKRRMSHRVSSDSYSAVCVETTTAGGKLH
eukprot:474784-Pelagomonas_calceolata.AAC.1